MSGICAIDAPLIAMKFQIEPYDFRIQFKQLRDLSGIALFVPSSFSMSSSPSGRWHLVQFFPSVVSCWRFNTATGIWVRGQAAGEEEGYKWDS